jgi:N-acyl-D-amino-acid deacylase
MFDILIRGGEVIDGRNRPRYFADIGIQGDRVTAVGNLQDATAAQMLDATGHFVAPGFIDAHTHSDGWLRQEPHQIAKTSQGFTTEFLMLDGISYAPVNELTWREWIQYLRPLNGLQLSDYTGWRTIGDYMGGLHGRTAQNVATFIPYANVRTLACGFGQRLPDDFQQYEIKRLIQQGMEEGALGLSTGLDYVDECFATTAELVAACRMMAPHGIYVTHVRYNLGTLAGVQEAVHIGRQAGVPVHISHLKANDPAEAAAIHHYLDTVAVNEVDFSFDVYPYLPSSTMLQYLLPHEVFREGPLAALPKLTDPGLRARFGRALQDTPLEKVRIAWVASRANAHWQGHTLAEYIAATHQSPADALCDLLISEGMAVLLVFHLGDDERVAPFLAHGRYLMGSDGIYFPDGRIHPRQYGSAARLLGWGVREKGLFSWETAVHKMTGFPAAQFGLANRGVIAEGHFADLVIFNPHTIADRATYERPYELAVGVQAVLVNGRVILQNGQPTPETPGRFLEGK